MTFLARLAASLGSVLALHARRYRIEWILALAALTGFAGSGYLAAAAPAPFPAGKVVVVREGDSATKIAASLKEAGVVRYPELARLWWRVSGADASIPAGAYRFSSPEGVAAVARRLAAGDYGIPPIRITFPEGATVLDMARRVEKALPEISAESFISAAGPYEGYLYPDTYVFSPSATAEDVARAGREAFDKAIAPLAGDIAASGRSRADIVIMASIIEREAARGEDRRMISGVLWNRIERGIPLQVDAVFGYINSRATYSPSYADLGVDSPYNTYKYAGLPPGPIANPGLSSIEAALHPAQTRYLYYLTGRDGLMHYAATYQGHKQNLAAYLQ